MIVRRSPGLSSVEPRGFSVRPSRRVKGTKQIELAKSAPYLLNLMWRELSKAVGTHAFGSKLYMFDQFLASRGLLLPESPLRVDLKSIEVLRYREMRKGVYRIPRRFHRPSRGEIDPDGYSDHFPVAIRLVES